MEHFDRRQHWEKIYQTKQTEEASWYQPLPETSLNFFEKHGISTTSKIIDVGGGDSLLVDHLLDRGHQDITLLDISAHALDKAKKRLGDRAAHVKWVVADVSDFQPGELYDCWHDRAAFHFLTQPHEVEKYVKAAAAGIRPGGLLVLGTFSVNGPMKCSGLDIRQYSEAEMMALFAGHFVKTGCLHVDHKTPSGVLQNFIFCGFMKC